MGAEQGNGVVWEGTPNLVHCGESFGGNGHFGGKWGWFRQKPGNLGQNWWFCNTMWPFGVGSIHFKDKQAI